ncbi:Acyl-coenzyme A thioesterase 8 [Tolypocladium capitatum]|uniref:Acyl-coenzyme A thioesterase 8 n=1 Tax=Tolypocladium capitatum TaxID=45235 RepID=A0A2K3QI68_9HYPO|nr:Acyl-coenzyme A thioesterase 8 [Tolypocladium capitatum]
MEPDECATLLKPGPKNPDKAPIENMLEVTEMGVLGPDIFTNTRRPWHPAGARGIYGGSVIAQCLASAQKTVPDTFLVHSCHCYFLLAGSADVPILFHVERVRDGRSFATRTVQARQRGRCIFTTTISFVRVGSGGRVSLHHTVPLPDGVAAPDDDWDGGVEPGREERFQTYKIDVLSSEETSPRLDRRKMRQWIRSRGKISDAGGHQAHLNALAYLSDSYFLNAIARIHRLWPYHFAPEDVPTMPEKARSKIERELAAGGSSVEDYLGRPRWGMLVSLDHSIYFHEPLEVRADEWMFTETESPWSGDGRGVVMQRIFNKDGTLVATCVQEGVTRLAQDGTGSSAKL